MNYRLFATTMTVVALALLSLLTAFYGFPALVLAGCLVISVVLTLIGLEAVYA